MLAQSFKSATELEITEAQKEALMKTLVLLETGKLIHADASDMGFIYNPSRKFTGHFNMSAWGAEHSCGTVACIGGTAEIVGEVSFGEWSICGNDQLIDLFAPRMNQDVWNDITPSQAATALRSYLTTGDAKWHEAVA